MLLDKDLAWAAGQFLTRWKLSVQDKTPQAKIPQAKTPRPKHRRPKILQAKNTAGQKYRRPKHRKKQAFNV